MFEADPLWILTGVDASATQWTPEALKAIKDAVQCVATAARDAGMDLSTDQQAALIALIVRAGVSDPDVVKRDFLPLCQA